MARSSSLCVSLHQVLPLFPLLSYRHPVATPVRARYRFYLGLNALVAIAKHTSKFFCWTCQLPLNLLLLVLLCKVVQRLDTSIISCGKQ